MRQKKTYESGDKMVELIRDNYNVLQTLSAFGISTGFGERTVEEICQKAGVDTYTFLAVVNHTVNESGEHRADRLSVKTLLHYLKASHKHFMEHQLEFVRRNLKAEIEENDEIGRLIMEVYDSYARDIRRHMKYEERTLFPYVEKLIGGETMANYSVADFVKQHSEADKILKELKGLILKYMPGGGKEGNGLIATLYLIYNNEEWLRNHQRVEDEILVPAIRAAEAAIKSQKVSDALSAFATAGGGERGEALTEREREVTAAVVQGMSNKEIAEHLCISPHTVTTHRKNITRKLQIHSTAGLTIYAIANGLIDIKQ